MATDDPGKICSVCRVYIPAGEPFNEAGGQPICLACGRQYDVRRSWFSVKRLGRAVGALTPYRPLIGLAAVVCLALVIGTGAWAWYHQGDDDDDAACPQWMAYARSRAMAKLEPLLRLRGEITDAALRQARRDQLLVMSVGLSEDEARQLLEAFAGYQSEDDKRVWVDVAYVWLGRELRPGRTRDPTIDLYVRRYHIVPERERLKALGAPLAPEMARREEMYRKGREAAKKYGPFAENRIAALEQWLGEADAGFLARPTREEMLLTR